MDQILPVSNSPNQTFNVTLSIDSTLVQLVVKLNYNEMAGYWVLNLYDTSNNSLLTSIPVLTGLWPAANLLGQQAYLNLGSWYCINVSGTTQDYPDSTNLGTDFLIVVGDTATS